jgi:hypothetical protein
VGISEARRTDQGLLVLLSRAAQVDTLIEVSPYLAAPEQCRSA